MSTENCLDKDRCQKRVSSEEQSSECNNHNSADITDVGQDGSENKSIKKLADKVVLIAGNGQFPIDFAKKASEQGVSLTVIGFESETNPAIKQYAASDFHTIKVGQFGKLLKIIKQSGASQAAFAGGISRVRLFRNLVPDFKALQLAAKVGSIKDDQLLRAVANEISSLGVEVINAAYFLDKAIPVAGTLTKRDLTADEMQDGLLGWQAAKLAGSLEIGQSVVVYKTVVLAVEAVEGTDEMIKRAGQLSNLNNRNDTTYRNLAVLVKVCKPQQDRRLDLPTFGPKTIETMKENGISALVIEAEASLLLDPIVTVELANRYDMAILAARNELDLLAENSGKRDFSFNKS